MRLIRPLTAASTVAVATAADALALPPGQYAVVPPSWNSPDVRYGAGGCVPELELEIWAPAALSLTDAVLYGARLHPLTYADETVTGATATSKFTKTAHGLLTGDGPFTLSDAGGALAGGFLPDTGYWVIYDAANTFFLADSLEDALSGNHIAITSDSTGTMTIHDEADTMRVSWETHDGLLGLAGDGSISLTPQVGYSKRIPHSPRVIAYALVGTIDTGTLSAAIVPIQDVA